MSKIPSWVTICAPEQFASLVAPSFCIDSKNVERSPIDEFISYLRLVLPLGKPKELDLSDVLGRVLLLGVVSGAEVYFRRMIAGLIRNCPLSRAFAADHVLPLAAADYYGMANIELGLVDGVSFSTAGEVSRYTTKLIGIQLPQNSSVATAISEFESLAHLRHAAVHASGELSPRNARALGIKSKRQSLIVRFNQIQDAAQICLNAVRAYNRFMFQEVVDRWIDERHFTGDWKLDRRPFGKLLALFRSKEDGCGGAAHAYHTYLKVQHELLKRGGRKKR